MNKKLKFVVCCFTSLIFISLILAGTLNVYAGGTPEPPKDNEVLDAPSMVASVVATYTDGKVHIEATVKRLGETIVATSDITKEEKDFKSLTADQLTYYDVPADLTAQLVSPEEIQEGIRYIVTGVTAFSKKGNKITADVVISTVRRK